MLSSHTAKVISKKVSGGFRETLGLKSGWDVRGQKVASARVAGKPQLGSLGDFQRAK